MIDPPLILRRRYGSHRIIRNAARCAICGDEIESTHRHDFVSCKCGEIFVDGGRSYLRRGASDLSNIIELSTSERVPAEELFKGVVREMLHRGEWPGPMALAGSRNLNGDQTRWRREVLIEAGFQKHPVTGRWGGRDRVRGSLA